MNAMVLSSKLITRLGAKARRIPHDEASILAGRRAVVELIDEFWIFYRNPDDYSAVEDLAAPIPCYVTGVWTQSEPLISRAPEGLIIRIPYAGSYLPLTSDGRDEIVLTAATLAELEEILATIKHAVLTGRADKFLVSLNRQPARSLEAP